MLPPYSLGHMSPFGAEPDDDFALVRFRGMKHTVLTGLVLLFIFEFLN